MRLEAKGQRTDTFPALVKDYLTKVKIYEHPCDQSFCCGWLPLPERPKWLTAFGL